VLADRLQQLALQQNNLKQTNLGKKIDLNNKFRREKPDESDTKMIRINVIRRGLAQSFTAIKIEGR
jgi:hypothetical protein